MPSSKQAGTKVVAIHNEDEQHENETLLQQAAAAEKNNDLNTAAQLYKQLLKEKAFNELVYKRLMVIYRKQKNYKAELDIINKGLKHFEASRAKQSAQKNANALVKKLSSSLNKKLGLVNSKGNPLYEPEPIPEWKRRKEVVEKKLNKG